METNTSNQLQISPTLERKRAKYTVEDVQQLLGGISEGRILGSQCVDSVALFLRSFEGIRGTRGTESPSTKVVRAFKRH